MPFRFPDDWLKRPDATLTSKMDVTSLENPSRQHDDLEFNLKPCDDRFSTGEGVLPPQQSLQRLPQIPGFVLENELGRGSMGVVYRAWQADLARHVALKFLKGSAAANPQERARWLREAQSLSRVGGRGIVQIFQIGEAEGRLYLVLELMQGGSLRDRLTEPLAPRVAARVIEAVARAVAEIHRAGLLHLDLKPSNILLDSPQHRPWEEMNFRIGDFGIARLQDDPVSTHRDEPIWGTPMYMAPEQAQSDRRLIGPWSDVYSIGATLHEVLTGRPPFPTVSGAESHDQVGRDQLVSLKAHRPRVPKDLEAICFKALQKDPERRYASASQFADDLLRFLQGKPVQARPVGRLGHVGYLCRRKPAATLLVAALFLTALGGLTAIFAERQKTKAAYHNAQGAQQTAVVSDQTTEVLLNELLTPYVLDQKVIGEDVDFLTKAEDRGKTLLAREPDNLAPRVALSRIYHRLGMCHFVDGDLDRAEDALASAYRLWDPAPTGLRTKPKAREWLGRACLDQSMLEIHRHQYPQALHHCQEAGSLFEDLVDELGENTTLVELIIEIRWRMCQALTASKCAKECVQLLANRQQQLVERVRVEPTNRSVRRQLALACFLLGEVQELNSSKSRTLSTTARDWLGAGHRQTAINTSALSFWRQAREHCLAVRQAGFIDTETSIVLALSAARLAGEKASDPYHLEAEPLLMQLGTHFETLLKDDPRIYVVARQTLEAYCTLLLCYSRTGRSQEFQRVLTERIRPATQLAAERKPGSPLVFRLNELLCDVAGLLREGGDTASALLMAREAQTLIAKCASYPTRDSAVLYALGKSAISLSLLLNQLGDHAAATEHGDLGLKTLDNLRRTLPPGPDYEMRLHDAWRKIAKARWDLGRQREALEAWRESAAVATHMVEQRPSDRVRLATLCKCYDRLIYHACLAEDVTTASDALREREKLCCNDRAKLLETADDYAALAKLMASRPHASAKEQQERNHYLAESGRVRAKAALLH